MTVKVDDNGVLSIYYNNELVVCHELSTKKYNYTVDTACEILKVMLCVIRQMLRF